jgi:ectoine hydroxylase-related dioxygenase (phytanoyl-CoA dioxygenase family)
MEKVTAHSRFGGLWIDYSDWREELIRRRADGQIDSTMAEQIERFERDGFLILPGAAPEELVEAFQKRIDRAFFEGNEQVLYQRPGSNDAEPLRSGTERVRTRVVDCFVPLPEALDLFTVPPLRAFLTAIFDAPPLLFQSLSFDQGSQQGLHQDTAYVVVDRPLEMAACWIALQDVEEGSGELIYVPGSHRLPDWDFGAGQKHWDSELNGDDTHHQWSVMLSELEKNSPRGTQHFYAKKGDILIWHADLAHGGATVTNTALRRQSLVGHFCPSTRRPRYFDHGLKRETTRWYSDIYYSSQHYDIAGR